MTLVLRISTGLAQQVLAWCCAISAGVHLALIPEHTQESWLLAAGFSVTALLLLGLTGLLALLPPDRRLTLAAAAMLVGLLWLYALSRTIGLPGVSAAEPLDGVGAATQVVQVVGLLAALRLLVPKGETS
jgi:hypothetical protein